MRIDVDERRPRYDTFANRYALLFQDMESGSDASPA